MNKMNQFVIENIPQKYTLQLRQNDSFTQVTLAAHIDWISDLKNTQKIPETTFLKHETLTDDEVFAFISQGKSKSLGAHFSLVNLQIYKLSSNVIKTYRKLHGSSSQKGAKLKSWTELQDFISEENFNYVWEDTLINLLGENLCTCSNSSQNYQNKFELISSSSTDYFESLIGLIYKNSKISNLYSPFAIVKEEKKSADCQNSGKISHDSQEETKFYFFYNYIEHNLEDLVSFSPQKLNSSNTRGLFILFQILNFLSELSKLGIFPPPDLTLSDFYVDEILNIEASLNLVSLLQKLEMDVDLSGENKSCEKIDRFLENIITQVKTGVQSEPKLSKTIQNNNDDLSSLVELVMRHWCNGSVSNYSYLMLLNYLCGRSCVSNANYHPVFPWVSDLKNPTSGWRDLTKTKFRINKGERQVELMFEERDGANVPHHVIDILSEITYYVYTARQTPKEVLCRFVRPKWVPGEYPGTVERLQEWTPDECIPEFYDSPSIFSSIHSDLPDLGLPYFINSPSEFINYHRELLESEEVSGKLHHWIDLTFGYKLSGGAGVKSKNIYLSLVDGHENLTKNGIVQLFTSPHPPKRTQKRNAKNRVEFEALKKLRGSGEDGIVLSFPKSYDPLGFLNDFEVMLKFFKTHFGNTKGIELTKKPKNTACEESYVKLFGCLVLELTSGSKLRLFSSKLLSIENRFNFYSKILSNLYPLPLWVKRGIDIIFRRDKYNFTIPLRISLPLLQATNGLSPLPFPPYFSKLSPLFLYLQNRGKNTKVHKKYEKNDQNDVNSDKNDQIELNKGKNIKRGEEDEERGIFKLIIGILSELDSEGLDFLAPFVIKLCSEERGRIEGIWNLFHPFSTAIGQKRTIKYFLGPLLEIYENEKRDEKMYKLFHRSFYLQLHSAFGLKIFLHSFIVFLIQGIGGKCHHTHQNEANNTKNSEKNSNFSKNSPKIGQNSQIYDNLALKSEGVTSKKNEFKNSCSSVNQFSFEENDEILNSEEIFEMEVPENELILNLGTKNTKIAEKIEKIAENSVPNLKLDDKKTQTFKNLEGGGSKDENFEDLEEENSSSKAGNSLNLKKEGKNFENSSNLEEDPIKKVENCSKFEKVDKKIENFTNLEESELISDMCSQTLIFFIHRLGPVLVAKFMTKDLLRVLSLAFLAKNNEEIDESGEKNGKRIIFSLLAISDLYGDSFIERQYIPYAIDVISSVLIKNKMSLNGESALLGAALLVENILKNISDVLLVTLLNDIFICSLIQPMMDLLISTEVNFSSGKLTKKILLKKIFSMLNIISLKIGPDMTEQNLEVMILQLATLVQPTLETDSELGTWLASSIFSIFYSVIMGSEYEGLIRDLSNSSNSKQLTTSTRSEPISYLDKKDSGNLRAEKSSFGSKSFGNRISIPIDSSIGSDEEKNTSTKCTTRHLKGNWLIYWDHEVGRSASSSSNFKQIKLQNFSPHSASVRSIFSLDNENSFITGSKDKTCRVYSLRNQGDERLIISHQWAYTLHKKPVSSILFLESLHLGASADGGVHLWDPFVGKCVKIYENRNIRSLALLPHSSSIFIGGGSEGGVTVFDPRTGGCYDLKIGIGQNSGLVRCMTVSNGGNVVSVGHSSGMISSVDLRFGTLLGSWKAHEGEVLQLESYDKYLISSSLDTHVFVWGADDNKFCFEMKGTSEPVHVMSIFESELISGTTSNRIGVHSGISPNSDFSSTRVRNDLFKGILSSMAILPLNQLFIFGTDSGQLSLLT